MRDAFLASVSPIPRSLATEFSGGDIGLALREVTDFDAWISARVAGVEDRIRAPVEIRRKNDAAMWGSRPVDNPSPRTSSPLSIEHLLRQHECSWLDWKRDFPAELTNGRPDTRQVARGKLLKSLVSIANSLVDERGYLVFGVDDDAEPRTVVGITTHFDDAHFQDLNARAFGPPVRFQYREEGDHDKHIGIFEVYPSSDFPHVCDADFGNELRMGQVWRRMGSRNAIAKYADLQRMFAALTPLSTTDYDGALVSAVRGIWEPQGWEPLWVPVVDRAEQVAKGLRIARLEGDRREIRYNAELLMLRRKQ